MVSLKLFAAFEIVVYDYLSSFAWINLGENG